MTSSARTPTSSATTTALDVTCVVSCVFVLAAIPLEWSGSLRVAASFALVMFAPGWAAMRAGRAPLSLLTVLSAVCLSISLAMLSSTVVVLYFDWKWWPSAAVWAVLSAVAIVWSMRRDAALAPPADTPQPAASATPPWQPMWPIGVTLAGLAISALAFNQSSVNDIDELGLIQSLPVWFLVGPALIIVGLFAALGNARQFSAHLAALIVVLHGMPGFIEPTARFPTAWLHVGFTDHIAVTGELLPQLDARFSWPGFFAGAGYLQRLTGTDDLFWLLRFSAIAVNLLAVAAVFCLARSLGSTPRTASVACAVFTVGNWIGQDYFAPQAIAFVITTWILTVVLQFSGTQAWSGHWTTRLFGVPNSRALNGAAAVTPFQLALIRSAVVLAIVGVVVSHQLSPPMLIATLFGLWVVQRTRTLNRCLIAGVVFVGWLSFAAEAYWLGHADTLFQDIGNLTSVVGSNVSERSASGSPGRDIVVRSRLALNLFLWSACIVSMAVQARRRRLDPAAPVIFFAPFIMLALQPYGGEMLLRVALFTLPMASIMIAQAATRSDRHATLTRHDPTPAAGLDRYDPTDGATGNEIAGRFDPDDFEWLDLDAEQLDLSVEALDAADIYDDLIDQPTQSASGTTLTTARAASATEVSADTDTDTDTDTITRAAPEQHAGSSKRTIIYATALILALPLFMLTRFGNESFERITLDDERVADHMYSTVEDGSLIVTLNRTALINTDRLDEVFFRTLPQTAAEGLAEMRNEAAKGRPVYAMLGDGQTRRGIEVDGQDPNWVIEYARTLDAADDAEIVFRSGDSFLIKMEAIE